MRSVTRGILLGLLLSWAGIVAAATERVALVIGNDTYQQIGVLKNARSDAHAMAAKLKAMGYKLIQDKALTDVNLATLQSAVRALEQEAGRGALAVMYYSGHGVEVNGNTYLLPVELSASAGERELPTQALSVQETLNRFGNVNPKFTLMIIDACRDNGTRRSLAAPSAFGKGVGEDKGAKRTLEIPSGTMAIFAAGANQTALDRLSETDPVPNGLFTRILLKQIDQPQDVHNLLNNVTQEVIRQAQSVNHVQRPALHLEGVTGKVYLVAEQQPAPNVEPAPKPDPEPVGKTDKLLKKLEKMASKVTQQLAQPQAMTSEATQGILEELGNLELQAKQRPDAAAIAQETQRLRQLLKRGAQTPDPVQRLQDATPGLTQVSNNLAQMQAVQVGEVELELGAIYRDQGQGAAKPLSNGAVLRSGDSYKLMLRAKEETYVYLFQEDSAGQVVQLFPMQAFGGVTLNHTNPLRAGQEQAVPHPTKSFKLDYNTGTETIYLFLARAPDPILEGMAQALIQAQRGQQPRLAQAVGTTISSLAKRGQFTEDKGPVTTELAPDPTQTLTISDGGEDFKTQTLTLKDRCRACRVVLQFEHR